MYTHYAESVRRDCFNLGP